MQHFLPSVYVCIHSYCFIDPIGVRLTGGTETTGSNAVSIGNIIHAYSHEYAIDPNDGGLLFRCVTGLGPTSNNNAETSALYFNDELIPHGVCNGPVVQSRGATISNFVGVINVFLCKRFTYNEEGIYGCTMKNSDMVDEHVRIGIYLRGRSESAVLGQLFTYYILLATELFSYSYILPIKIK